MKRGDGGIMKKLFDDIRKEIDICSDEACFLPDDTMVVSENGLKQLLEEAEAKLEAEVRKHDIEVRNKAIDEFAEKLKFEYRESVGTTKRERNFAEAVIEQVAHSLKISEVKR